MVKKEAAKKESKAVKEPIGIQRPMPIKLPDNFIVLMLDVIDLAPWNYKSDDATLTEKLKANILRNGQIVNCNVREMEGGRYEVIDGNHRLEAMRQADKKEMVCYNHGKINLVDAKRIAVELNETRFASDPLKLAQVVKDLSEVYDIKSLAETLPYPADDIENMIKLLDYDFQKWEDKPDDHGNTASAYLKIPITDEIMERWNTYKDDNNLNSDRETLEHIMQELDI